jgi:hypothetical protein
VAFESRGGRRVYYTRSRKVNGRVRREYVGCGPTAWLAAEEDTRRRAEREAHATATRTERATLQALDGLSLAFSRLVDLLVRAVVLPRGWVQRKGEWRRRT